MGDLSFSNTNELEMYKQIVEKSTVGIYVIEKATCRLLFVNDVMKKNVKNSDYKGQICHKFLQNYDDICPFCIPFRHLSLGKTHEIYTPSNQCYYSVKASEINWHGTPAYIEYIQDITEEKKNRLAIEKSREEELTLKQTIVDNIPGGVIKMHLSEGVILPEYMSKRFCEMMDDTRENLMKMYQLDAMAGVHPDDLEHVKQVVAAGMDSGESFRVIYRICNSRGEYKWVKNRASRVEESNGAVYYYAVYTDMDQEMKVKKKAEQTSKEIEMLYNAIPGAVFKCSYTKDWDVLFANDGLFRFIGYTREEFQLLFDNKMSGVIHPADAAIMMNVISEQLKHGTTVKNENRLICKDGSVKWISIHAELMDDEQGKKYFYCTFVEITDQIQKEKQYRQTIEAYRSIQKENVLLSGWCNITNNQLQGIISRDHTDYMALYGNDRDAFFDGLSKRVYDEDKKRELIDKFKADSLKKAFKKGITRQSVQCRVQMEQAHYQYVELTVDVMKRPGTKELTGFFNMTDLTEDYVYRKASLEGLKKYGEIMLDIDAEHSKYRILAMRTDIKNIPPKSGLLSEIKEKYLTLFADEKSKKEFLEKSSISYVTNRLKTEDSFSFYYHVYENEVLRIKKGQIFYIDKVLNHIAFICIDVTETVAEEHRKNEELSRALNVSKQANRAKTDFLSRMSHDMRTPMNIMYPIKWTQKNLSYAQKFWMNPIHRHTFFIPYT